MLSIFNAVCVASSTETVSSIDPGGRSGGIIRLALRNPMHDTSLYDLINTARQQVSELQLENSNALIAWVEQNIVPRVRSYLEEQPEIVRLLEENARIELSLDGTLIPSDANPITMIIDRWSTQNSIDAVVSAILYPASIPMRGDECNYFDTHELRRLALSAFYGNPIAYHHIAIWAYLNQPDTNGLPRDRELFYEERVYDEALRAFERYASRDAVALTEFQRRILVLCRRDLRPETTQREPFILGERDENQDPRLLFNIGITGKNGKNKESLLKSRRAGFLKAKFHETRYMRKTERISGLQRLKKELKTYESLMRSRNVGSDLLERIRTEVDQDLARVGKLRQSSIPSSSGEDIKLNDSQVSNVSKTIFEIITHNK